jgi:acetyl-CoA carboxylase carboxyl transferase subunit alpha
VGDILVARHPRRPVLRDYIDACVKDFCELHGDRCFGNDKAIVTGFGRIGGIKASSRSAEGRDTKERIERNFAASPRGLSQGGKMKLAEKSACRCSASSTPGQLPRRQGRRTRIAQAIAVNLMEMSRLRVPICCLVIGEAQRREVASAWAIGWRCSSTPITPSSRPGCAAILWKTAGRRPGRSGLTSGTSKAGIVGRF